VRRLTLHTAVAVPVPRRAGGPTALVLDSRRPLTLDVAGWEAAGSGFAGLCALLLDGPAASAGSSEASPPGIEDLVGRSAASAALRDEIARAALTPLPVLVVGASGTGKELVARALHDAGPRARGPFVAVNCSAIPEPLLERELFGAERGAFTGADRDHPGLFRRAQGGTLLLDEIGDMPLALQAKLLRVVQEGAVRPLGGTEEIAIDVRLVAATHRDLDASVAEGRFRADLRFRLAVLVVRLPPLDERKDDLPVLADRLLGRLARRCGLPKPELSGEALAVLERRSWPGNVRELDAVLARALVRTGGREIGPADLDPLPATYLAGALPLRSRPWDADLERAMIVEALAAARGNLTAAAERIGWNRQKLYRRLKALGLPRGDQEA
jgi:DNA-binding NtrC family response regulator